ncbi:hypothetical protein [Bradyrhizobium viridifuturi]|uniref:hypothetical protein n=1 Tax=Bradyrhizobium viridifuturi TaxID=1654716 RepID=UPI000FE1419F|nr:hypothetical protein [Bradyrhizobium viridifuturi]
MIGVAAPVVVAGADVLRLAVANTLEQRRRADYRGERHAELGRRNLMRLAAVAGVRFLLFAARAHVCNVGFSSASVPREGVVLYRGANRRTVVLWNYTEHRNPTAV